MSDPLRPAVRPPSARDIGLFLGATLAGPIGLLAPTSPSSSVAAFLPWVGALWYVLVTVAGVVGLVGAVRLIRYRKYDGLLYERIGQWILGLACTAYGLATLAIATGRGVIAGIFLLLVLAGPSFFRLREINRDLHPDPDPATDAEEVR